MKSKFLIVLISMVIGAGVYKVGEKIIGKARGVAVYTIDAKTICTHCDYSTKDRVRTISFETAQQMSKLYYNRLLANHSVSDTQNKDSRSVWFSVRTLKNFLWEIESRACNDDCFKNNELGVRIYFAEYPGPDALARQSDYSGVDPLYAYHHTLFMVPTFNLDIAGKNLDFDFNPWALKNGCSLIDDAINKKNTFVPFLDTATHTPQYFILPPDINAMNHASMLPPGKPTGAVFIGE